jgi:hypothetical protein
MMDNRREIAGFSTNLPLANSGGTQTTNILPSTTWEAFRAGMQILQRYSVHSPLDFHTVAKSNLLLLHRSLSNNTQYNNKIENMLQQASKSGLPTTSRMYTDKALTADLLILQEGMSINLSASPAHSTMYLLISGRACYDMKNDEDRSAQHWWKRINSDNHKKKLRSGAVVISSHKQKIGKLKARGKKCVLLKVHTPMHTSVHKPITETPWKIASSS